MAVTISEVFCPVAPILAAVADAPEGARIRPPQAPRTPRLPSNSPPRCPIPPVRKTLSVTVAGVPTSASLSAGADNGDGS